MESVRDVTAAVKSFYEENPFPDYDDVDSRWTLRDKAREGVLAQLLDDQIGPGATILELGCGTGQLSNFLALQPDRTVVGTDISLTSLRLARQFARKNGIGNVTFVEMDLFRPVFRPGTFDVVICNGVLHHTADPLGGLRSIASLLADGGVIMVGLYNRFGRVLTNVRRGIFGLTGGRLTALDPRLRAAGLNEARRRAWFLDQYRHPHESQHTLGETLRWFDACGLTFVNSIPKCQPFGHVTTAEDLFGPHSRGTPAGRAVVQLKMAVADREGGFYVMLGRKGSPARAPDAGPPRRATGYVVAAANGQRPGATARRAGRPVSFHEDLAREEAAPRSSDRSFGLVFAAFFAIIGVLPAWGGGGVRPWSLRVALAFLVVALLAPVVLRPLNRVWAGLASVLHHVVNPVVMGAIFFLVVTPIAIVMRLFRRDVMKRRFDVSAHTYWIERESDGTDAATMRRQF